MIYGTILFFLFCMLNEERGYLNAKDLYLTWVLKGEIVLKKCFILVEVKSRLI